MFVRNGFKILQTCTVIQLIVSKRKKGRETIQKVRIVFPIKYQFILKTIDVLIVIQDHMFLKCLLFIFLKVSNILKVKKKNVILLSFQNTHTHPIKSVVINLSFEKFSCPDLLQALVARKVYYSLMKGLSDWEQLHLCYTYYSSLHFFWVNCW